MLTLERARWFVVVPLLGVTNWGLVTAVRLAVPSACVVAAEWVGGHKGSLPTSLAEIRKYPTMYQRTIYGNLSNPERLALWREKLAPYAATVSSLPASQRALVQQVLAHLGAYTPDPVGVLRSGAARRDGLSAQLVAVFGSAKARALFDGLEATTADGSPRSVSVARVNEAGIDGESLTALYYGVARLFGRKLATAPLSACSCYTGDPTSSGCPFSTVCKLPQNGDSCSSIGNFCGAGGNSPCDGLCY